MVSKSDSFYFLVATFQQMKQLFSRVDGDENFIKLIWKFLISEASEKTKKSIKT